MIQYGGYLKLIGGAQCTRGTTVHIVLNNVLS